MPGSLTDLIRTLPQSRRKVLAILAHPDDEALLCGGTLAELARESEVHFVCVTDGWLGREQFLSECAKILGITYELRDHPSAGIVLNGEFVGEVDRLIQETSPGIVITHTASGAQHQDHVTLHDAVQLVIRRADSVVLALATEPPISSTAFQPSVFVDVAQSWEKKMRACGIYRGIEDRYYMRPPYLQTRAAWWAQVSSAREGLVEAFELIFWRSGAGG